MSSSCSSRVSPVRPHRSLLLSCQTVLGPVKVVGDPYDLSTLQVALRSASHCLSQSPSDDSSISPLPQPSSLRRTFRSDRPARLSSSSSPPSSCYPSPSSSPLSSPSSPTSTEQRSTQPAATLSPHEGAHTASGCMEHCRPHTAAAADLLTSPYSSFTPLSSSSTVTSTPSSSLSSFPSPSSVLLSPLDGCSSLHFAWYSPAASLSFSGSPAAVPFTSPLASLHHSSAHRPVRIRIRRKRRQLAGGEHDYDEQQQQQQRQQQPDDEEEQDEDEETEARTDGRHIAVLPASSASPLPSPSRLPSHRVLPPRPPRPTLRTLRVRTTTSAAATATFVDTAAPVTAASSTQPGDSEEGEGGSEAEEAAADGRGKRRRKWLFSPPLSVQSLPQSASTAAVPGSSHRYSTAAAATPSLTALPTGGAAAASPLHRLRRLDPVVSSMHAHLTQPSYSGHDSSMPHAQPLAAISRQRQSVLDRLQAIT